MKFIANPTEVDAWAIVALEPVSSRGTLDLIGNSGLILVLDDGTKFHGASALLAMFTPSIGDYLVESDYAFICPRAVFEKQYHVKKFEEENLDLESLNGLEN